MPRRISTNGKYYCGGSLGTYCSCCDGNCGPDNGCNCLSCMRMDVESRGLPRGWLINEEGKPTQLIGSGFRCGGRSNSYSEKAPYCAPCKKLNDAIERYRPLL